MKRILLFLSSLTCLFLLASCTTDGGSADSGAGGGKGPLSRDNSKAELTRLGAGSFKVGTDIPAGRYVVTADKSGNLTISAHKGISYIAILNGSSDEIGIGVPSLTCDLSDGQSIEISSINEATFTPAETKLSTTLSCGTWTVGLDIEAGRYAATPKEGESGNFFVYDGSVPKVNQILDGKDSGIGVKSVTVDLKKGQIIQLSSLSEVSFEKK